MTTAVSVRDASGSRFEAELVCARADGSLRLRTRDGRELEVPPTAVARIDGTDVHLEGRLADVAAPAPTDEQTDEHRSAGDQQVIPVVEEQAVVETRSRSTSVHVHTTTTERWEDVVEALRHEYVDIDRVTVERYVDTPEPIREEGDVTVVPLHEEVLVVEKRLLLREELHLRRRHETREGRERVRLRRQDAEVERSEPDED